MKNFFWLLLAFEAITCFAQNQEHIRKAEIDSLLEESYLKAWDEPLYAGEQALEMLKVSEIIGYPRGMAGAYLVLGILHKEADSLVDAYNSLNQSLALANHMGDGSVNKGIAHYQLAKLHESIGNTVDAVKHFELSIQYFEEVGKVIQLSGLHLELGVHFGKRGLYTEALAQFTEALRVTQNIADQDHKQRQLVSIHNDFAMVYNLMGEPGKAYAFALESIAIAGDKDKLKPETLNTIARIHENKGEIDSAKHYYKMAYEIAIAEQELTSIVEFAKNIAHYFMKHRYPADSAQQYLDKALAFASSPDATLCKSGIYQSLGQFHANVGNLDSALLYTHRALPMYQSSSNHLALSESYLLLSDIHHKLGDADSALAYFQRHSAHEDTIYNTSNERKFSNLRVHLETLKEKERIANLNREVRSQRAQMLVGGAMAALLFTVILVLWKMQQNEKRTKALALKYSELQRLNTEEKLRAREEELADHTLHLIKKNRFLDEIEDLAKNSLRSAEGAERLSKKLIQSISRNKTMDRDWEEFSKYFGQVHADFFDKLKERHPKLTGGELRHCALVRMNLSLKESAEILGIDPNSVKVARYRIKKKMNIDESEDLHDYILSVQRSIQKDAENFEMAD